MNYNQLGRSLNKWILNCLLITFMNFPTLGFSGSDRASTAKNLGQFSTAISHWKASLPNLNLKDKIPVLLQIAETYLALGQVHDALEYLQLADKLSVKQPNSTNRIQVLGLFSDLYLLNRNIDQAFDYAKKCNALARELKDKKAQANTLIQLGNVQMAKLSYQNALDTYQEAIKLFDQQADKELSSKFLINSIHAHLALDLYDKAIPLIQQSMKITLERDDSHDKAIDLIAIGHLIQQVIDKQEQYFSELQKPAYQAYTTALNIGNQAKNTRIQSYAYGHLGELYLSAHKLPDAEILLRKALFTVAENQMPELSARWYWQLGRLNRQKKQEHEAVIFFKKAVSDLESVEPALIYGYRGKPRAFLNTIGVIYLELAELLLQQSAQAQRPKSKQQALNEVKQVMEQFKTFELKNYFQDDCVTELQNKLIATDVDKVLEPTTAVLYPIVLADRLIILLSFNNGQIKRFETAVTSSRLKQSVIEFREQLLNPGNPRRLRSLGLKLYDWLIKPTEQALMNHVIDTLVIVPDDVLRGIPYAALFDGKDFLITKYAIAITPGLSLTNRIKSKESNNAILLTGLSEAVQNFNSLPFVTKELSKIASIYDDNSLLLNQEFQKNKVKEQLSAKSYATVVFSTHAHLAANPKQSFLLTYDKKINLDELEQFIRKTSFHDQTLDLLVLSACDTARGDERALLGLAGIAVKSGANSVLASLWPVNDASTADLIPSFFEHLNMKKTSKAKALQLAQKQLLSSQQYRHPFYWAGFVMIGEWQ